MELHQLRTFVAVAEEGHLTRAAERLSVSQPAVSAHIKMLEGELGVPLFQRTSRGMRLTREGSMLVAHARRVLAEISALLGQARSLNGRLCGVVSLGVNTDSGFLRLGDLSARLRQAYPGLSLSLVNSNSWDIQRDVRRGDLDAGFVYADMPSEDLQSQCLRQVPFCVVGPATWKDRINVAGWKEIAAMPWIWMANNCPFLDVLDERFARVGVEPTRHLKADHEDILRALSIAGEGLTLMRQDEARIEADRGKLSIWPGEVLFLSLYLIMLKRRQEETPLRALRDMVAMAWTGLTCESA